MVKAHRPCRRCGAKEPEAFGSRPDLCKRCVSATQAQRRADKKVGIRRAMGPPRGSTVVPASELAESGPGTVRVLLHIPEAYLDALGRQRYAAIAIAVDRLLSDPPNIPAELAEGPGRQLALQRRQVQTVEEIYGVKLRDRAICYAIERYVASLGDEE